MHLRLLCAAVLAALLAGPAAAESEVIGGDLYTSGSGRAAETRAERDLFLAGRSTSFSGEVVQDAHLVGADVELGGTVGGGVYAAGGTVTLRATVAEDVTAAGGTLRLADGAEVAGNARLAGGTVRVEGPVAGALVVAGGEVILDAEIGGDVRITAGELSFGPRARIGGTLRYAAPDEVAVPPGVIAPDRVRFERLDGPGDIRDMARDWGGPEYPAWPAFAAMLGAFLVTLGFFTVLAALFLGFAPRLVATLEARALARPGITLLAGVIGLSFAFGLVPIAALTIVGILLVPFVLLFAVALWALGYLLGAYAVAMRVWLAFGGGEPPLAGRLALVALAITLVALVNYVPVLGWLLNFALVLFGVGAMTAAALDRMIGRPVVARDVDMNPIEDD